MPWVTVSSCVQSGHPSQMVSVAVDRMNLGERTFGAHVAETLGMFRRQTACDKVLSQQTTELSRRFCFHCHYASGCRGLSLRPSVEDCVDRGQLACPGRASSYFPYTYPLLWHRPRHIPHPLTCLRSLFTSQTLHYPSWLPIPTSGTTLCSTLASNVRIRRATLSTSCRSSASIAASRSAVIISYLRLTNARSTMRTSTTGLRLLVSHLIVTEVLLSELIRVDMQVLSVRILLLFHLEKILTSAWRGTSTPTALS